MNSGGRDALSSRNFRDVSDKTLYEISMDP